MAAFALNEWLAMVPGSSLQWLSDMTRAAWELGRRVLHTAYIPGQLDHYIRARRSREQLDALAAEWSRRRYTDLSLQLFRMADQMRRIVRQHETEMLIRQLGGASPGA